MPKPAGLLASRRTASRPVSRTASRTVSRTVSRTAAMMAWRRIWRARLGHAATGDRVVGRRQSPDKRSPNKRSQDKRSPDKKRRRQCSDAESLHRTPKGTPDTSPTGPPAGFPTGPPVGFPTGPPVGFPIYTVPGPKTLCRAGVILDPLRSRCNAKIGRGANFLWISLDAGDGSPIAPFRATGNQQPSLLVP